MTQQFNIKALIETAVVDERSGAELYKRMAGRTQDAGLQKLFGNLARQEQEHERRFSQLLEQVEAPESWQYPDPYVSFLESLVAQGGRADSQARVQKAEGDAELLAIALGFEQEQLALQREMGDLLGDTHRRIVDEIIDEERAHLVQLSAAQ